jgi:hypothetical protein
VRNPTRRAGDRVQYGEHLGREAECLQLDLSPPPRYAAADLPRGSRCLDFLAQLNLVWSFKRCTKSGLCIC